MREGGRGRRCRRVSDALSRMIQRLEEQQEELGSCLGAQLE
jgi:hypothetical protein